MYVAIRQYEMGAGSVEDFARIVDTGFADKLSARPGFVSYQLVASGSDEIVSITVFENEQSAVESNDAAAEFVHERLQQFQLNLTSSLNGEVVVSRPDTFPARGAA
jgi:heme-degrading monooxygenase HmoA